MYAFGLNVIQEGNNEILGNMVSNAITLRLAIIVKCHSSNEVAYDKLQSISLYEQTSVDAAINYLNQMDVQVVLIFSWVTPKIQKHWFFFPDENYRLSVPQTILLMRNLAKLFPCDNLSCSLQRLIQLIRFRSSFESFRERLSDTENGPSIHLSHPVPNAVVLVVVSLFTASSLTQLLSRETSPQLVKPS
ncbi:hypothetical protein BON22_5486 [Cyberlindnera fabianii]|uniref:Uncharacterized protein n=1 Tax=Cyberlindnera fabianii TaxID=36022 RepID=A0A1V2L0C5_CYBFA|nr:hypothetical protein BON22_5486 [Cyberlindnera fabianii]